MNLSKPQLIFLGAAGFIVVIFGLVFTGIVPGLQEERQNDPQKIKAELQFWGIGDNARAYEKIFADFKTVYPNVKINYRGFGDESNYETVLLDALAAGKGPDIFMIKNAELFSQINKISPAPATSFSLLDVRRFFPKTVERDFVYEGTVYALPLSIDTLALIYNRDVLNRAGVALIPENWTDFMELIPKITRFNADGKIEIAGAAIGGSEKNIKNGSHLLYALMLQFGVKMTNPDFKSAAFASKEGTNAFNFFIQFADAKNKNYTWNETLPDSINAISRGSAAIIFDHASAIQRIKSQNRFVDLGVAPLPQQKNSSRAVTYADYWGYAVSNQSKNKNLAWDFVIAMTIKKENAKNYADAVQKPPALLTLIDSFAGNPEMFVFAKQALIAESWPQADSEKTDEIFSQMIELANSKTLSPEAAIKQAQEKVSQLMTGKTF